MLMGFRAGADPDVNIRSDDFAGYRKTLNLPAGTAPIGRVFPDGAQFGPNITAAQLIAKAEAACAPVLAAGMWPYLSFKPHVAETLNGGLDQHLIRLAHWISGLGTSFYFSAWHEPENNTLGVDLHNHLGRAGNFVAVHKRAYRLMKDVAGDALQMGPCHMAYQWRASSETTSDGHVAQAWRVPDDHADFYAVDSYTSNWSWPAGKTLKDKGDFQRWLTRLAPTTSKILLAERGITRNYPKVDDPAAGQATLLAQDYDYLKRLGALGLMYWNSGGSDNSVYLLGELGRTVFRDLAIAAAAATPPPPADRYQEGYDVGHRAGLTEGVTSGRQAAFREVSVWAAGNAGPV